MSLGGGGGEPDPTAEERALARKGAKDWNRYVRDILPTTDVVEENVRADAADRAAIHRGLSDAAQGGSAASMDQLARQVPLSSGTAAMNLQRQSNDRAAGLATGLNESERNLADREVRGLISLAASGRDLEGEAVSSLAQAGSDATQLAAQGARNDRNFRRGLISATSTVAGGGLRYYQGAGGGGFDTSGFDPAVSPMARTGAGRYSDQY